MLGHRALTLQDYTHHSEAKMVDHCHPGDHLSHRRIWHYLPRAAGVYFADACPGGAAEGSGVLCQGRRNRRPERAAGLDEGTDSEPVAAAADHRALQPVCEWQSCRWTIALI